MRYFFIVFMLTIVQYTWAQVKGNKAITTENYTINNLFSLKVDLYAEVVIDCAAEESLTITTDENLHDLIDKSIDEGHLTLMEEEWIQPSQPIRITIGAPDLERIEQSVHETTRVKNLNRSSFRVMAIIGEIVLEGKVEELYVSGELGTIDARALTAPSVDVNLWGQGKIELGSPEKITGIVKREGTVLYEGKDVKTRVNTTKGGRVLSQQAYSSIQNDPTTRFIDIKIKNNSPDRIEAYVIGPKPDGKKFSYGFPLRAGQVKEERWTVGTKVYEVSNVGFKKKLVEIKDGDEGEVVKLFPASK